MSSVMVPQSQQKSSGLSKLAQVGGAIAGGMATGGIGGVAAGAGLGGMAAGLLGGNKQAGAPTAIDRRTSRLQESNANLDTLRKAEVEVAKLPPQQQQQYAPAIVQARKMAESEIA